MGLQSDPQRNGLDRVLVILEAVIHALLAIPPMNLEWLFEVEVSWQELAQHLHYCKMSGPNNMRV